MNLRDLITLKMYGAPFFVATISSLKYGTGNFLISTTSNYLISTSGNYLVSTQNT